MGEVLLPLGAEKLSYATELLMLFNGALILHSLRISLMFGVQLSVTIGVTYTIVDTAEHTHTHPFNGPLSGTTHGWWRGTVVERRSLAGELSLSCARPAADG